MVDDCYEKQTQEQFMKGLSEVNNIAKKRFQSSFVNCSPSQREAIISDLEMKKDGTDDQAVFYSTMKELTIKGFLGSKYVLTNVFKYELVPGRYNGFASVPKTLIKA